MCVYQPYNGVVCDPFIVTCVYQPYTGVVCDPFIVTCVYQPYTGVVCDPFIVTCVSTNLGMFLFDMPLEPPKGIGGSVIHLTPLPLTDEEVMSGAGVHVTLDHVERQFIRGWEDLSLGSDRGVKRLQ